MANIRGNGGDNLLRGTRAADKIFGYAGADSLYGHGGADRLYGGRDDDLLDGGGGNDLLDGGRGNNRIDGGAGVDTASYAARSESLGIFLDEGRTSVGGVFADRLFSIENAIGGAGDDRIIGDDAGNRLRGAAGDDYLAGGMGGDILDGGRGDDMLWGDYAEDEGYWLEDVPSTIWRPDTASYAWSTSNLEATLSSFALVIIFQPVEIDELWSVENLWSGSGDDSIAGSNVGNELRGGGGADTLFGHSGNDTLWGQGGRDLLLGGDGVDTAVYSDNSTALLVDLGAKTVTFVDRSWAPERILSIENIVAGSGDDTLIGGSFANVLDGGAGADSIGGRGGADTVSFATHTQSVRVNLATGVALAVATGVRDSLTSIENATGGAAGDTIAGSAGANRLDGAGGDDSLSGGGSDDTLVLSSGEDTLYGGAGADALLWRLPYEANPELLYSYDYDFDEDTVSEGYDGDRQPDAVIDLAGGAARLAFGTGGTTTLRGIEGVVTGTGNDHVLGSARADVISVGHGANLVEGRGGNDRITGSNPTNDDRAYDYSFVDERDADEVLRGGAGNDTIVGGTNVFGDAGDDTLIAGWASNDYRMDNRMTGGAGADRFVFSDEHDVGAYHGIEILAQKGTLLDFDAAEGDRVVIDRVDDSQPLPEYVGVVDSLYDIGQGSYGFVVGAGGQRFLYYALAVSEEDYGGYSGGLAINGAESVSVDDVLFV